MGAQQRVYKQRIRSAQGMKKIFKAKEMVAASRIAKAHARVEATTPYAEALTRAGVTTLARGSMLGVDAAPAGGVDVRDLIRDTASDLGLGLVRLQVDHRRIEDVFADAGTGRDE